MSVELSTTDSHPTKELETVGRLASYKMRAISSLNALQGVLIFLEFICYIFTFFILFTWRVGPEYGFSFRTMISDLWLQIPVMFDYALFISMFIGLYWLLVYQKQFYDPRHERGLSDEFVIILKAIMISFLITLGVSFLLKNTLVYSRVLLVTFLMTTYVEASLFRYIRKRTFHQLKKSGKLRQRVLIVGAGRVGQQLYERYTDSSIRGIELVGFVDERQDDARIIGDLDQLEQVIKQYRVDILYITIPSEKIKINTMLQKIYKYHIDIRIIPELFDRLSSVYEYRQDFDYPCLQIVKTPMRGFNLIMKRSMDIILSAIGIIVGLPLLILVALLIKINSPGPILFKQTRIGRNGVKFTMLKFRSMVNGAEGRKRNLLHRNEATGHSFKLKSDPRVTRVGSVLRKYSIDELPQLWNVLKGEMSLIGPRPSLPEEVQQYSDYHWRRMDVRPGMTGLWQVSGRSDLTFEEWINLDIQYIERWSLAMEMKILIKTVPVVIKGTGAY
ncbi:MAG: sugar transferase [Candidatus Cohnella colombiensis]|uniref:Sugar transferase n=1 Tax=Candidatus Cohnella colombiensis TaxID=3121368 RepID=A0AA95EW19_9BACL|nr:MAG: sugar transferase [Cohnella sp.]